MECCSLGVATLENTPKLAALLRGMCHKYGEFWEHVLVLKVPLQGGMKPSDLTEIRIIKSFPQNPQKAGTNIKPEDIRWTVRHLSEPQRSRQLQGLPATVRELIEAECWGADALAFWQTVGAKVDYEFYQSGNEYFCHHENRELQVRLLLLTKVQGNLESTHHLTTPDNKRISDHLLQVTLRVDFDDGLEGAQALTSFGQRLLPLIQLKRAQA